MSFYRNPFVAFLAASIVAVGIKGSPVEPSTSLGTVRFCSDYGLKGNCDSYQVPADSTPCKDLDESFNNAAYSFASDPGMNCVGFENPGCPILRGERSINLGSQVYNLSDFDFGGIISSFRCVSDRVLGWASFCYDYELKGGCAQHRIATQGALCHNLGDSDNDKYYSFKSTPGMECTAFNHIGCGSRLDNPAVALKPLENNLTNIGFGGKISSFTCISHPS